MRIALFSTSLSTKPFNSLTERSVPLLVIMEHVPLKMLCSRAATRSFEATLALAHLKQMWSISGRTTPNKADHMASMYPNVWPRRLGNQAFLLKWCLQRDPLKFSAALRQFQFFPGGGERLNFPCLLASSEFKHWCLLVFFLIDLDDVGHMHILQYISLFILHILCNIYLLLCMYIYVRALQRIVFLHALCLWCFPSPRLNSAIVSIFVLKSSCVSQQQKVYEGTTKVGRPDDKQLSSPPHLTSINQGSIFFEDRQ